MRTIRKLLAANRSEIATRVFRSAHELGIRTVAIYSHEDRFALHRFKADEAYQIGEAGEPIRSYLNIDGIVSICQRYAIDAVHPGYGFLSENPDFATALEEAGIIFVGPSVAALKQLGDKVAAREIAIKAGVPVLPGSARAVASLAEAKQVATDMGYPVILKAAKGGGGRGMRMVDSPDQLATALESAQRESLTAFGSNEVFVEKLVKNARHIEVQLLGDDHGNLIHLHERVARCNGGIRRSLKSHRLPTWSRRSLPNCTKRPWRSVGPWVIGRPGPSSSCMTPTASSSTSSRSIRGSRWSIP